VTDTYESPLPSRGSVPPPTGDPLPGMEGTVPVERRLTWQKGLIGLFAATAATFVFATLVAGVFAAFGNSDTENNHAFQFIATLGGDVALVLAAYYLTADLGHPTPATFGFRRFHPSAYGWVLVAFVAYLALAGLYTVLVNPPTEDLPDQLGADESVALAVITGLFVVVVAPFVEEFFFRGFLYQALRNSWGTILGIVGSALIFAFIHFAFDKFVPLFFLGVALAMLFEKTGAIWPCIMLHALNNSIAFAVSF
jgi:CAAX protease family protein